MVNVSQTFGKVLLNHKWSLASFTRQWSRSCSWKHGQHLLILPSVQGAWHCFGDQSANAEKSWHPSFRHFCLKLVSYAVTIQELYHNFLYNRIYWTFCSLVATTVQLRENISRCIFKEAMRRNMIKQELWKMDYSWLGLWTGLSFYLSSIVIRDTATSWIFFGYCLSVLDEMVEVTYREHMFLENHLVPENVRTRSTDVLDWYFWENYRQKSTEGFFSFGQNVISI